MLGFIFKQISAVVSTTVDGAMIAGNAIVDDVASIPDAIQDGWNEGLLPDEKKEEPVEEKKHIIGSPA